MNPVHFPDGVVVENLSGSGEIISYDSEGFLVPTGINIDQVNSLDIYDIFYNTSQLNWNNGNNTTMQLDVATRNHPNFSLSSNEVSVSGSGEYYIEVQLTILAADGGRKNSQSWLELNGVEIAGTRGAVYQRQTNHGGTCVLSCIIDLVPSDSVAIITDRTNGSGNLGQIANGTRFYIQKRRDS